MNYDFDNERPIWMQLAELLKKEILAGRLLPDEKIPSVREMAAEARINPNTVQRAYAQLEREGLVYTKRGSGKYVSREESRRRDLRRQEARKVIQEFLKEMDRLGVEKEQWMKWMEEEEHGTS